MIKHILVALLSLTISIGLPSATVQAHIIGAEEAAVPVFEEAIISYDSKITVNVDNSIDVIETIVYHTGATEHHGIYRDIYPYSSEGKKMSIENVRVVDESGNAHMFERIQSRDNVRIKIGDPQRTFAGQKTYVIHYRATRAVAQLENLDEIYWNVTGNDWGMPIYHAHASVLLPQGATLTQSACYVGPKGSTERCSDFSAPSTLNPREGLTIAAGFGKGIVAPYSTSDAASDFFYIYGPWLIAVLLPIATLIFSLRSWYKKGRDARKTGIIIPHYDVPDELTPMEVVGIANEKVTTEGISAEIIYLATKGYIKIEQLEERFIGLIKSTDYQLIKLKDASGLVNDFDQKLLNGLFTVGPRHTLSSLKYIFTGKTAITTDPAPGGMSTVKLSSLKYTFYHQAALIVTSVLDALLNKGYYKNLGRMKVASNRIVRFIFIAIWASLFVGGFLGVLLQGGIFPLIAALFSSIIIYGIVSHFSPSKTEKGVIAKEHILGLKEYMQIAEKDRLIFHNAPDKKPEVFEKLLPYAMVLGVADIWAKEFEGIYTTAPSWYSGSAGTSFSAVGFSHSLSSFSSFASSSLTSAPGGGSGGGGSSGGGGGGGGGGSW